MAEKPDCEGRVDPDVSNTDKQLRGRSSYLGMTRLPPERTNSKNFNTQKSLETTVNADSTIARWTVVVGRWTRYLTFVSIASTLVSFFTLLTIKGQLDEMRDEQRPWIAISIIKSEGLRWNGTDLVVRVTFQIENVGRNPAAQTYFSAIINGGSTLNNGINFSGELSGFARKLVESRDLRSYYGSDLLPTQKIVENWDLQLPEKDLAQVDAHGRSGIPHVIACTSYSKDGGQALASSCTGWALLVNGGVTLRSEGDLGAAALSFLPVISHSE